MRLTALIAYAAAAVLTLTACGDEEPGDSVRHDWDGVWVLASGTQQGGPLVLVDSHPVTLVLDGDAVSGISACNHYGGTVTRSGDSFTVGAMSMTEMACPPDSVLTLESAFHAALNDVTTAALDGDLLTLSGDAVELVFERQPAVPSADLLGTTWMLDSLLAGDVVSSTMGTGSLILSADGTVSGSTGCRNFTGSWEQDGTSLRFQLATTRQACPDETRAQDQQVLAVLDAQPEFAIDGQSLTLTSPAAGSPSSGLVYGAVQVTS